VKRREFFGTTVAAAMLWRIGPTSSQPSTQNRALVAIGVDKAGDLPKLKAAATGASSIAQWLVHEGFETKLLTDKSNPVRAGEVFDTVAALVNRGTLEQLVIYFAGHGFAEHYAEYWLLSGAPANPNEAISVIETVYAAHSTGIPNVVIVSDACRSRPGDLQSEGVHGSVIFPINRSRPPTTSDVDVLYATVVGDPSWEVSLVESTGSFAGIFTSTLLDAYKHPDDSMVAQINGKRVVPNVKLKPFLMREVPRRAQAASISISQRPDIQIVSGDSTYLGTVTTEQRTAASTQPIFANYQILTSETLDNLRHGHVDAASVVSWVPSGTSAGPHLVDYAKNSGFVERATTIVTARGLTKDFLARSGFTFFGSRVISVRTPAGIEVRLFPESALRISIEVVLNERRAAPISVRFEDGSGCVLVALQNYIGSVVIDDEGVANVGYVPSHANPLYSEGLEARLTALHATIATSARSGAFRIEGGRRNRQEAERLAGQIRILKGYDATLGLYAAYAYAQADIQDQVRSVQDFMHEDYGVELFDLGMLAGSLSGRTLKLLDPVLPPFPMLSQGWSLLRVRDVKIPESLAKARDHLQPSLWTTFKPVGMDIIERGFQWTSV
jgi:hypothetical protein